MEKLKVWFKTVIRKFGSKNIGGPRANSRPRPTSFNCLRNIWQDVNSMFYIGSYLSSYIDNRFTGNYKCELTFLNKQGSEFENVMKKFAKVLRLR